MEFSFPKFDHYPLDFDWLYYHQEPSQHDVLEHPPLESNFVDFNYSDNLPELPYQFDQNYKLPCIDQLQEFEDYFSTGGNMFSQVVNGTFSSYTTNCNELQTVVLDHKPQTCTLMDSNSFDNGRHNNINIALTSTCDVINEQLPNVYEQGISSTFSQKEDEEIFKWKINNERMKSSELQLDEIQKHFGVPIAQAAKELKVGLTVLKKRCRQLNIMRWPHRKIKSLKSLISNVKEMGLTNEITMLEEHERLMQKLPDMQLTEKTKKLRQACFKANYKKRRSLATHA